MQILVTILLASVTAALKCHYCRTQGVSEEEANDCRDGSSRFSMDCPTTLQEACIKMIRHTSHSDEPMIERKCVGYIFGSMNDCRRPSITAWHPEELISSKDINCFCVTNNCNYAIPTQVYNPLQIVLTTLILLFLFRY